MALARARYLGIVKEATWGAGGAPATFLEFRNCSVKNAIEKIRSEANVNSRSIGKIYNGSHDVGGSFEFEVNPDNIGLLLFMALGAEAAAAQVLATSAYDHVFTPADDGTDLGSFCLEVGKAIKQFRYAGCKVSSIQFSASKGSVLLATVNVLGQSEDDTVGAATPTYSTKLAFVFDHGEVEIDGGGVAFVRSFDITIDNLPDAEGYLLDGTNERGSIEKQGLTVTGTMTLEYNATSYAQRTAYAANTTKRLTLVMTSTEAIEAGYYYTLTIDVPEVKYLEAGEDISGREAIPLTIGWEAIKPASGSVVEVTLRDALTTKWSA